MSKPSVIIFTDADNTLWDTDRVYADAQLALFENVEAVVGKTAPTSDRLSYIRAIDQAIAERHHTRLRYPPRFLVRALAISLAGNVSPDQAARMAWASSQDESHISDEQALAIEGSFFQALKRPPALRKGVRKGLKSLKQAGHIVFVITEGSREKVLNLLRHHRLGNAIDRVLEGKKERRLFERVLKLTQNPQTAFMIGDQLDRDIRPAKEAGLITIYFPGGFRPKWLPDEASVGPDKTIDQFGEAVNFIETDYRKNLASNIEAEG